MIYRHRLFVRLTHGVNAICIVALILSGIEILAHHPELYWGENGFFGDPYFLSFGSQEYEFIGMGPGRSIHFLAAWVLVFSAAFYFLLGFLGGHIARDLLPDRDQLDAGHVRRAIADHLRLRHDAADAARRYNLVQKLAYLAVIFVLGPLIVLTGLAMSPAVTASYPFLIEMWGGRQTARSVHFIVAASFLLFLLVHLWQVWLVGWRREVRAIVTGWYRPEATEQAS